MASPSDASLIELIEAMLAIAAREVQFRPTPKNVIKPGGFPEDIFLDLTDEERNEFECSICYQIIKEAMQCMNNHKFCHSCIYVWSTTGEHLNRTRCPVCRAHGYYRKCSELDEQIGAKKTKCNFTGCHWSGPVKYWVTHKHTNYSAAAPDSELPSLKSTPRSSGPSFNYRRERLSSRLPVSVTRSTTPAVRSSGSNQITPSSSRTSLSNVSLAGRGSASEVESPSSSPILRHAYTPRPPSGPRPNAVSINQRRTPTLPSLIHQRSHPSQSSSLSSLPPTVSPSVSSISPGRSVNLDQNRRDTNSLGSIRERLQESRLRLDTLMSSFSGELERSRQDAAEFQMERERIRRQQLQEVREMGRRLGYVAAELRRLLNRQSPPLISSDSEEDLDDLTT